MKIKHFILSIFIIGLGLVLMGCTPQDTNTPQFTTDDEILGVEVMSIGYLVNNLPTNEDQTKGEQLDVIESLNEYVGIIEQLLAGENNLINSKVTESDLEAYKFKMVVITNDLKGNQIEYLFYYNVVASEKTHLQELEGVICIGEIEYPATGTIKVHNEKTKISFESSIDEDNNFKVFYEDKDNETKFTYHNTVKGITNITRLFLKEKEIKLILADSQTKEKYIFTLITENNQEIIIIRIDNKDETIVAKVYISIDKETGEVIYDYELLDSKTCLSFKRKHAFKHQNNKTNKHNNQHSHNNDSEDREPKGKHNKKNEDKEPKGKHNNKNKDKEPKGKHNKKDENKEFKDKGINQ